MGKGGYIMGASKAFQKAAKDASNDVELIALFNGKGDVIAVMNNRGHGPPNIHPKEVKRIFGDGVLASDNWCRWIKLADGTWR
jgi:hypothetical protein